MKKISDIVNDVNTTKQQKANELRRIMERAKKTNVKRYVEASEARHQLLQEVQ